jgi:hypothetical protein
MDRSATAYESQRERASQAAAFRQRLRALRTPLPSLPPSLPGTGGQTTTLEPSYSYRLRGSHNEHRDRRRDADHPFAVFPLRHGGRSYRRTGYGAARAFRYRVDYRRGATYDARSLAYMDDRYAVNSCNAIDPGRR